MLVEELMFSLKGKTEPCCIGTSFEFELSGTLDQRVVPPKTSGSPSIPDEIRIYLYFYLANTTDFKVDDTIMPQISPVVRATRWKLERLLFSLSLYLIQSRPYTPLSTLKLGIHGDHRYSVVTHSSNMTCPAKLIPEILHFA